MGRFKGGRLMGKWVWLVAYFAVLIWSGINPKDYFTWFLEVVPALIAFVVMAFTYQSFRLTPLLYTLILIHCIILMVGGHYTYAEVPLFDWLAGAMDWSRNNYDKVGHFAQGFVPVMVAREIVIRKQIITFPVWRNVFIVMFCLGFSAFYELVEWWVALATGEGSEAFLGTQGYIWDTQSDMAFALLGAIMGLILLSKWHDNQLHRI